MNDRILKLVEEINAQEFVFFIKEDDVATLNIITLYITKNEHTRKLKIVTVLETNDQVPENLLSNIEVLDREYPKIDIEFISIQGTFGLKLILLLIF